MKILIIFLFAASFAFSQNNEPGQHQFTINGVTQNISSDSDYFNLSRPILGFHWGDQHAITKSLLMNQCDITSNCDKTGVPDSTLMFIHSEHTYNGIKYFFHSHCAFDTNAMFGKSICYDPSLYINPADKFKLNIHPNDPQNPVFGFLHKRGRIPSSPSDPNYSRIIIDGDSLVNSVVLSDPWPSRMKYYNFFFII